MIAFPKTAAARSEPYRRHVAQLACKACGIQQYSQAAHHNSGKAKGSKADDRACFALCCDQPDRPRCQQRSDARTQGNDAGEDRRREAMMQEPFLSAADELERQRIERLAPPTDI